MVFLVGLLLLASVPSHAQFNSVSQFTHLFNFIPPLPSAPAYNATPAKDSANLTHIPKVVASTTTTAHPSTTAKPEAAAHVAEVAKPSKSEASAPAVPASGDPVTIPVQQCIIGTKICTTVHLVLYSAPSPAAATKPKCPESAESAEEQQHDAPVKEETKDQKNEKKVGQEPSKTVYVRAPPQFVFAPAPLTAAPQLAAAPLPPPAAPQMMPFTQPQPMPMFRPAVQQFNFPAAPPPPPPAFHPAPAVPVFSPAPMVPPPMPRPSFIPFVAPPQHTFMQQQPVMQQLPIAAPPAPTFVHQQQPVRMMQQLAAPPPMYAPQPMRASLPFPPPPPYFPAPVPPPVLYNSPFFFRTAVGHAPPMAAHHGAPAAPVAYPPAVVAAPQMTVPCSPMQQLQQPCSVRQGAPLAYTVSAPAAINAANAAFAAQMRAAQGQGNLSSVDANWPVHLCVGNIVHQLLFGHIVKHAESGKMRYYQDLIEDAMKKVRSEPCVPLVQAYPWMINMPYVGWRGFGEMRGVALELIHYVEDEIKQHQIEMSSSPDDTASTFVGAYLEEMKKSEASGANNSFHMDNLVNTATDIWLAGMETAATSIRWGLLLLTAHPEIQDQLYEEIQSTVGKSGRRLTMADKVVMPYASAFVYEVHRVSNVVTFNVFRRNFEDDKIGGHNVPAGTTILPQISTIMASDDYFDNADRFDPERFLIRSSRGMELRKDVIDKVVAFSLGKRQCAGEALARTEMFLVLLSIVQRYRLETTTDVVDTEPVFGILQTPAPSKWRLVQRD